MGVPNVIRSIESCLNCGLRASGYFCQVNEQALGALEAVTYPAAYPRGAVLFVEGQQPRGVFLLCRGRVKLTMNSPEGKTLIFKIAEAGEILGLSAAVLDKPFAVTAETIVAAQLNFVRRSDFLCFLNQNGEAAIAVAQQLGDEHHLACREMASLGLAQSAAEKLASLFLDWAASNKNSGKQVQIRLALTHEEMAQMIGTSRETVTRLLSKFKRRNLIQLNGSVLRLRDTEKLRAISSGEYDLDGA